jgi:hypothetical protein
MKSIFASKTFWLNVLSLVSMVATATGSPYALLLSDPQTQTMVIGGVTTVANIALRAVTSKPVKLL